MDKDLETFMQKNKQMDKLLEDELDNLIKEDAELKNFKKRKSDSIDLDELDSDLDNSKEAKSQHDEELEKLEKEGLDGLDALSDDEDNKNEKKKEIEHSNKDSKEKPKEANVDKTKNNKAENKDENIVVNLSEDVSAEDKNKEDIYREPIEKLYHNQKKMHSAGVLEDEKSVMDEIIAYKKKHNVKYDYFSFKKDLLDGEIQKIQHMIVEEILTLDGYKASITVELNYEKKLLELLKEDKNLKANEKKVIEDRINKRIQKINEELEQQIPEEEEKGEEEKPADEDKKESNSAEKEKTEEQKDKAEEKEQEEKIDLNRNSDNVSVQARKVVEIKDMFLYETLKKRMTEYKLAIEYFEKNGLQEQEKDAMSKAREIQKAIIKLEDGKEIDEVNIPESINPEYICGYSKQERLEKFTKLIKEYNNIKNEISAQQNKVLERFNQLAKKDQLKIKDHIKKDLEDRKEKIEKYEKLIKKLVETSKNPWTPCPFYSFIEEEEKIEKTLEEVPQNAVQIEIESTTYDKDDAYIQVCLVLSETKTLAEWVYLKEFPKKLNWKLEKSELNTLYRKNIEISLYRTHWYWPFKPSVKGSFKVKLDTLKSKCQLQNTFDMTISSGRISPQFKIAISLRNPVVEKEYTTIPKQVIQITKAFPEFNKDGIPKETHSEFEQKRNPEGVLTENDIKPRDAASISSKKETTSEKKKPENAPAPKKNEGGEAKKPEEKIDASEFSKEDLDDPDNQDNMLSLKYMEHAIARMDQEIKKIEGRPPQKLRQKFLQTKCRYNTMKEQVMEGAIAIENYAGILNKQIQKDKRLAQYFNQNGIKDKAAIVFERLKIIVKELEEAMTHLKK